MFVKCGRFSRAVGNPLNKPPEDYDRKVKTQTIRLFRRSTEAHVV